MRRAGELARISGENGSNWANSRKPSRSSIVTRWRSGDRSSLELQLMQHAIHVRRTQSQQIPVLRQGQIEALLSGTTNVTVW